jgi:hypothetical protein
VERARADESVPSEHRVSADPERAMRDVSGQAGGVTAGVDCRPRQRGRVQTILNAKLGYDVFLGI